LEIAQACFASGKPEAAKEIIKAVAEDHHESDEVLARARSVFVAAGLKEEGEIFLEATRKQMIKLNNDAVALAKAGDLDHAIAMLQEAADRLINNCQVAINAALAILMQVQKVGPTSERFARAQAYILQARRANPEHPRLTEVAAFYRKLAPPGTPIIEES
jgi:tetratricopeptide (TPR) repeat protein